MSGERTFKPITEKPFRGVVDGRGIDLPPGMVARAINMYLDQGRYVPRPGSDQLGDQLVPGAKVQLAYWQQRNTNDRKVFAFAAGRMFELTWGGTPTWAEIDISLEPITIDPAADIDYVTFHDWLCVTDGVNQPWIYDGVDFTVLAEAPVARCVTVYYSKLVFGNLPGAPMTVMWSEEAEPELGYEGPNPFTGGVYDNAWDFAQSDTGRVNNVFGMNEALLFFKEDSASSVRGPTEDAFTAAGVRPDLSGTVGISSPRGAVAVERDVYGWDSKKGPWRSRGGIGQLEPISLGRIDELVRAVNASIVDRIIACHDPVRDHVLFAVPLEEELNLVVSYGIQGDPSTGMRDSGFAWFVGWTVESMITAEDDAGNEYILFGDDDGNAYRYGIEDQRNDLVNDAGFQTIRREIVTREIGREVEVEKHFDMATFHVYTETDVDLNVIPVADEVPSMQHYFRAIEGDWPKWDIADWDIATWGGDRHERRVSIGLDQFGYGMAFKIFMDEPGQTFWLLGVTLEGTIAGQWPHVAKQVY